MLEFYIDGDFKTVYVKIGSKNYVCKKNIRNWIVEDLDVPQGEYVVDVLADNKKGKFDIKVIKGIEETDYDL